MTNITCCPLAHYAAVGTASGKILFIDLNFQKQLRLVHEVYLYHTAVDHLAQVSSVIERASIFRCLMTHKCIKRKREAFNFGS